MFLALFALLSVTSHAKVYSWQDCVNEATRANAELHSALRERESTRALQSAAAGGYFPEISASAGTGQGVESGDWSRDYTTSLNLKQNLFSGFGTTGKYRQAVFNTQAADAALQLAKAKLSFELKSAFQGLYYSKRYYTLAQDIVRRRRENLRLVELRYESGRENKGSVLLAKAYFDQATLDELTALHNIDVAKAQLAKAIGLDDPDDLEISGDGVPMNDIPTQDPSLKHLALKTPEHLQAVAEASAAQQAVKSSRSVFFPSLDLTASIGDHGDDWYPEHEHWSVGMTLTLPLFNGFKDSSNYRSSAALSGAAESNRQTADRAALAKLKDAHHTYVESVTKLKVDQSFREAAVVRAEIARNKYNSGLLTFDNWDTIETDLVGREKNYLQSVQNRVVNEAAWEQAQGKGVIP